jgi:hypothetical protein
VNIFVVDENPHKAAQSLVNKHVVKMVLESCQLLSTAHRVLDGRLQLTTSLTGRKSKVWIIDDYRAGSL